MPDVAVDRVAAALASAQDGVAGRGQLRAQGVSEHAIDRRVRSGRFTVVFRGVYAIGHAALGDTGRARAALLAAGPAAVVSHHAAAALYKLIPSMPRSVDVTVTGNPRRSRPGLAIHVTRNPPETTTIGGLPVTTPLRTLQDLRRGLAPAAFERLCADALVRTLVTLDGWRAHGHRFAFERDRARDADLAARGYVVLRFTWRQLRDNPLRVAAQIAQALAHRTTGTSTVSRNTGVAGRWAS